MENSAHGPENNLGAEADDAPVNGNNPALPTNQSEVNEEEYCQKSYGYLPLPEGSLETMHLGRMLLSGQRVTVLQSKEHPEELICLITSDSGEPSGIPQYVPPENDASVVDSSKN